MGQEIAGSAFTDADRLNFRERLREETKILKRWFDERAFDHAETYTGGLEVEAWLVDENHLPAPRNEEFLSAVNHPLVVPELSKFNYEINSDPLSISGDFLSRTYDALKAICARCDKAAETLNMKTVTIGILPTVRDEMLQPKWMSESNRYRALNTELFKLRADKPIHIDIEGEDQLEYHCDNLMLEAACTSLQSHLKMNQDEAVRLYNASLIAAGPLVAASANAPFLYGKSLWAESRIPTFEQATAVHGFRDKEGRNVRRVSLGVGYLRNSFLELFIENMSFPVLLPSAGETDETLPALRMQNGTIWRWNRPILGFDKAGKPHLRIEQRVTPAGPTIHDMVANMALYFGMALALARAETPPETETPFEETRANFYACAKDGLNARVRWAGEEGDVQSLLLRRLIPAAKAALAEEGLSASDLDYYFDEVLHRRMLTGLNGAKWQRSFARCNGRDFQAMTECYRERQAAGEPVGGWSL